MSLTGAEGFDWRGLKIVLCALTVGLLAAVWRVYGCGPSWLLPVFGFTWCAAAVGAYMHTRAFVRDAPRPCQESQRTKMTLLR